MESDDDLLKGVLNGISDQDFERVKRNVLGRCFRIDDEGNYYNESQVEIYEETRVTVAANKARAEKAAKAKWDTQAMHKQCTSNAQASHEECTSNAQAMLKQCSSNAQAMLKHRNQNQNQNQSQIYPPNPPRTGGSPERMDDPTTGHHHTEALPLPPEEPIIATKTDAGEKRKLSQHLELVRYDWHKLDWDYELIPESYADTWRKTFPAVDIVAEMRKAAQWLASNPDKRKKNYYRFLANWFGRAQERGGA